MPDFVILTREELESYDNTGGLGLDNVKYANENQAKSAFYDKGYLQSLNVIAPFQNVVPNANRISALANLIIANTNPAPNQLIAEQRASQLLALSNDKYRQARRILEVVFGLASG